MQGFLITRRTILSLFLLVYGIALAYGQTEDSSAGRSPDGWIEKINDKITVDMSFNNSYETFEVKTPVVRYLIYPNASTNWSFNANYRFLSLGIQLKPGFLPGNGDEESKGKTKSYSLGTSFRGKHWMGDLSYSKIKGYYLKNTKEVISWAAGDPYIQFPDQHYKGFSSSVAYSTNSRFSFRSITSQTERQLKNAGSFIPVFHFRYYKIDDLSSGSSTQKSTNTEAGLGLGYMYTVILHHYFYFSTGLESGLGYLNTLLTTRTATGNIDSRQDNYIIRWDNKTGIGYNGPKFYAGFFSNLSGSTYQQENTTAKNAETRFYYRLFLGVRLESPGGLKRRADNIQRRLPFLK